MPTRGWHSTDCLHRASASTEIALPPILPLDMLYHNGMGPALLKVKLSSKSSLDAPGSLPPARRRVCESPPQSTSATDLITSQLVDAITAAVEDGTLAANIRRYANATLGALGASFDCASAAELRLVLSLGF